SETTRGARRAIDRAIIQLAPSPAQSAITSAASARVRARRAGEIPLGSSAPATLSIVVSRSLGACWSNGATAASHARHLAAYLLAYSVAVALLRLGRSLRGRSQAARACEPSLRTGYSNRLLRHAQHHRARVRHRPAAVRRQRHEADQRREV